LNEISEFSSIIPEPRSPLEGRDSIAPFQSFFGTEPADENLASYNEVIQPELVEDNITFLAPEECIEDEHEGLADVSPGFGNVDLRMTPRQVLCLQKALPPKDLQLPPILSPSATAFLTDEVSQGPSAALSPSPSSKGLIDPECPEGRGVIERIEGYQRKIDTLKKLLIDSGDRPSGQTSDQDRDYNEESTSDDENSEDANSVRETGSAEGNNNQHEPRFDRFSRPQTPVPGQGLQITREDDVFFYLLEAETWDGTETQEEEFGFELETVASNKEEAKNRSSEPQLVEEYTYLTAGELELRRHENPLSKWSVKHPSPLRGELMVVDVPDQQVLKQRRSIMATTWSDLSLGKLMKRSQRVQRLRAESWS
jgi:hypothetical protein